MKNHDTLLTSVLAEHLDDDAVDKFFSYRLTAQDIAHLKETALYVLKATPAKGFNCAAMSAMWGALLQETSSIPVQVVCGHLDWKERRLFYFKEPIAVPGKPATVETVWEGHCWLEFGGVIADISIGRTIKYGVVPDAFRDFMIAGMGDNPGLLCATPEQLSAYGLTYTPCGILNEQQINGLLSGALPADGR